MAIKSVDIGVLKTSAENAKRTEQTKITMAVEGRRRSVDEDGQTSAEITMKNGTHTFVSDEPPFLGGKGMFPNPMQYVLYGVCACVSTGVAKIAAVRNITLDELKVKVTAELDIAASLLISEKPIFQHMNIDIKVKSKASQKELNDLLETVKPGSPVLSVITTAIRPDFTISNV